MPKPYPQEFRDDVVKVARNRPEGVTLEQIAADFGIHPMTLSKWMRQAAIEDGDRPGVTTAESAENREMKQADPSARAGERGAASSGRVSRAGEPPKRLMYPLVRELAADGIPVVVSCRVLDLARQPYYRWLDDAVHRRPARRGLPGERDPRRPPRRPRVRVPVPRRRGPPRRSRRVGSGRVADLPGQRLVVGVRQTQASARDRSRARRRTTTWCAATSPPTPRTSCGSPTSPSIAPREGKLYLLRDQGRVLEPDRRLGHRRPDEGPARGRRDRDGRRPPRR